MSDRTLPATPRRLALARKAGLVAHAPSLTAAASWAGALVALIALGPSLALALRAGLRRGLEVAAQVGSAEGGENHVNALVGLVGLVGESAGVALLAALPVVAAAAALAAIAHVAQVRALWLPRRRIAGAPQLPSGMGARAGAALWASLRGGALAAAGLGWLVAATPRVAQSLQLGAAELIAAGASLLAGAALVLVATWLGLGALELIGKTLALAAASRMTAAELREELRAAGGGGRKWAQQRRDAAPAAGTTTATASRAAPFAAASSLAERLRGELALASFLVSGDELCAVVAWHPARTPAPRVLAARRGPGTSSLLAEARRQRLPVHRAPELAHLLVESGLGEAPREAWPALARLVALAES